LLFGSKVWWSWRLCRFQSIKVSLEIFVSFCQTLHLSRYLLHNLLFLTYFSIFSSYLWLQCTFVPFQLFNRCNNLLYLHFLLTIQLIFGLNLLLHLIHSLLQLCHHLSFLLILVRGLTLKQIDGSLKILAFLLLELKFRFKPLCFNWDLIN